MTENSCNNMFSFWSSPIFFFVPHPGYENDVKKKNPQYFYEQQLLLDSKSQIFDPSKIVNKPKHVGSVTGTCSVEQNLNSKTKIPIGSSLGSSFQNVSLHWYWKETKFSV